MAPLTATVCYVLGICILFWLERNSKRDLSAALWIPVISLLISGSRPLALWAPHQRGLTTADLMEGSPLDATVALGLIIVGLVVLVGRQHEVARLVKVNLVAVFFLSYCALSISWSDFPEIAAKRWIRLLGTFITVLIVLTDRDPTEAMKSVLTRVAFVLIPVSVLLIKYYPDLATYYDAWSGMQIVSGVATDKNMLGMMCLVYGSVILFSFLQSVRERKAPGKSRRLVANALVLAMGFWLLHSADSMTALSCFCFASVLIVFSGFFRVARKPAIIHLLVVGILGATAGILFLHVGEAAALEKMGRNPTLTGRTEIWSGLLSVASNPVFGAGYESFYLGDRLQRIWAIGPLLQGVNEAHNGYLETYLNLGWIGIASLVAFIVAGYRNVIVALQRDFDAGRLKLAFFVAAIAYNFTEAGFRTGSSVWFAFLFAALSVPQAPMLKPAQFTKSDRVRNAELKPVTP